MPAKQESKSKGKKQNAASKKGKERFEQTNFVNLTPPGQLKEFGPMAANYTPAEVEAAWDTYWEAKGFYGADVNSDKEPFVMVMPPPNVTGTLHLGHALTLAIEDCVVRWQRMQGKNVLWVPGTDHAGIATQVVVEKKIMREQKKTRHDLGRDNFLKEVWKWKDENGGKICNQLRRLGASVDWTRERFTMDDRCNVAVKEAFVQMCDSGKIYRANRLVNWSCTLNTAISQIEVDHMEVKGPTMVSVPGYEKKVEVGVMHSFAYRVKDSEEEVVVATTRIETMLGDVAVAVHPDDKRYTHLHGKQLVHPFVKDRVVTIITDDVLVDMAFGTGAVKITPAHDPNDFECGVRHNLPMISVLDNNGKINQNGGQFAGEPRFITRETIIVALEKLGLYRGKTSNPMSIGFCSRSKDIVEPILRPQWYLSCTEMGKQAMDAVKNKELNIVPSFHEATWNRFLENDQAWCISRQLWWGHRIPAYLVVVEGEDKPDDTNGDNYVVGRTEEEAMERAKAKHPNATKITLEQDPDVLDTWFSSGLFPFSVMGWPHKTPELEKFFPGHLLESGHDIIFFWVARMVMMSLALTGKLPFNTVYLHAMVRDRLGRKMSKSLGNVLDPIDVMEGITLEALQAKLTSNSNLDPKEVKKALLGQQQEFPNGIAQCGTDALRFGLLAYTTQGRDINLNINNVISQREFCNKLWNATKFALMSFDEGFQRPTSVEQVMTAVKATGSALHNTWILSRLGNLIQLYNKSFRDYEFGLACQAIRDFWLNEFCNVYLEVIKPVLRHGTDKAAVDATRATLFLCLDYFLRLNHPMMPFVTEELFHRLPNHVEGDSIMVAKFPTDEEAALMRHTESEATMELALAVGVASRSMRASMGLTSTRLSLHVGCADQQTFDRLSVAAVDLVTIAQAKDCSILPVGSADPAGCVRNFITEKVNLFSNVQGIKELGAEVIKRETRAKALMKSASILRLTVEGADFKLVKPEAQGPLIAKLELMVTDKKALDVSIANFISLMDEEQLLNYKKSKIAACEKAMKKVNTQIGKLVKKLEKTPDSKKSLTQKEEQEAALADLTAELATLTM